MVDFGCADCQVLPHYKCVQSIDEVAGVYLDGDVIERHRHMARPLNADYLQKRQTPLTVRLFCGSITEFDARLADYDAVTMIEV